MTSKTASTWVPKTDHSTNNRNDLSQRNLHVVCNGKIDEKAEEERKSLIKSMSKRNTPNAVANKWAPIKEKDSKEVLKEQAPRSSALKSLELWEQRKSVEMAKRSEEQKIIDARRAAQEEQRRIKRAQLLQRYSLSSPPTTEQKPIPGNRITSVTNDPTPKPITPPPTTIKYIPRKKSIDSPSPFENRKTCPPVVLPRTQFNNRSTRSSSSSSSVITTEPQLLPSSPPPTQKTTHESLPSPKIEPKTLDKEQPKNRFEELKPAVEKSTTPPRVTTELYLDVKTPEKINKTPEKTLEPEKEEPENRYSVIEDGDNSEFLTHLEEIEQHDFDISGLSPSGLAILRGNTSLKLSKSQSPGCSTSGRSRNSSGRSSVSDRLKKFENLDASANEESSVLNTPKWSIKERSPEP